MAEQSASTAALLSCYDDLEALIDDLGTDEWGVQSLCPDWDVRGVVAHLTGVEHLLVGWAPQADDEPPPFQKMAEFEATTGPMDSDAFVALVHQTIGARRAELPGMSADAWAQRCMAPIGPATYGRFMDVRVFDFWVHQRDMTQPLGRETVDSGPHAEIALDEVHGSLGYIVGKKIGLPDGMSIAFHLTGPVERDLYAAVDGRAAVVDDLADPSVEVEVGTERFAATAEELTGDERARAFGAMTAALPRFADYQDAVERQIPVIRLRRNDEP